jgi:hypothetical protein
MITEKRYCTAPLTCYWNLKKCSHRLSKSLSVKMQEFSGCRTLEFEFMLREAHPTESHEEKID